MRILPEQQRDAIFAVYAFCREVDDIADGEDSPDVKRASLDRWRRNIEHLYANSDPDPATPVLRALRLAITHYDLDKTDFLEIISGMEMDTDDSILIPDCTRLQQYCDRVAGAVGLFVLAPAYYMPGFEELTPPPPQIPLSIVHGWHDDIVPVENSIRFAQLCHATLHVVDGDHRLTANIDEINYYLTGFLNGLSEEETE